MLLAAGVERIDAQFAARRLDHPGAGEQVADAQAILVEQGEEQEDQGPGQADEQRPAAAGAFGGVVEQEGHGKVELDLAHQVARDHPVGGEALAAARDDAKAQCALAPGRGARAHLEDDEVEVAEQEEAEQPDDDADLRALQAERADEMPSEMVSGSGRRT